MKKQQDPAYGLQLTLDGYAASEKLCGDVAHLYKVLMELPSHIGMRRVGFPHIIKIDEEGIKGLSGFVFIMESHISVHTYEERGFVTVDVYSCKTFDEDRTKDYLMGAFGIQAFESNLIIRGKRFHQLPLKTSLKLHRVQKTEPATS
jgi:S-adenosylmethionine decarboxylase